MFRDVGGKLKTVAVLRMVLMILPYLAGGIGAWVLLAQELDRGFLGFLAFVFISAYGVILSWLKMLEAYGFGELVETVVDIDTGVDMLIEKNKEKN